MIGGLSTHRLRPIDVMAPFLNGGKESRRLESAASIPIGGERRAEAR
jgi:hypothetical protein